MTYSTKFIRSEHETEIRKRQEEIATLKSVINKQMRAYNELKLVTSNVTVGIAGDASTTSVVAEKIARIRKLEDDIAELQASCDELSHQLAEARNDAKNNHRTSNVKQKELEEYKENVNIDSQMRQVKHKQVLILSHFMSFPFCEPFCVTSFSFSQVHRSIVLGQWL